MHATSRLALSGRSRRFAVCRCAGPFGGTRPHVVAMVLILTSAAAAHAESASTGFYRGTIQGTRLPGGLEVAMSLCTEGNSITGSYFYLNVGTDIALRGTLAQDGTLELEETSPKGLVTGRWTGRLAKTFKGTWTPPKGDVREFELSRVGAIPADSFPRSTGAPVERHCSDIGYRMARTGKRGDYFPRLVRFRDKEIMASVNAVLDDVASRWFDEMRDEAKAQCDLPADDPTDVPLDTEVGVEHASHDVFSIRMVGHFVCVGLADQYDSVTFDLRTGMPVVLEELFREDMPWREVIRLLFAYQFAEAAKGAECLQKYNEKNLDPYLVTFQVTADGLVVQPRYNGTRSDIKCWQRTVVPFAVLRTAARPGSVLERTAAAAPAGAPARYRIRNSDDDEDFFFAPPVPRH